jgi:hypothetical protein
MAELDLTPDPRFRRNLNYSSGSKLVLPGAPPKPKNETMSIECPKCKHRSSAPISRNPMICMADSPPHVGEGRGCGWLLGLDLPQNPESRIGRAFAVIDLKLGRISEEESRQLMYKGFRMVTNHWVESGKLKLITDDEGRVVGKEWID